MLIDQLQNPNLDHPSEDALERFLMHRSETQEVELVETHILGCDSCVSRLESIEIQIAATKLALSDLHQEKVAEQYAKERNLRRSFFSAQKLSWASGIAALALVALSTSLLTPAQVNLAAYRGSEATIVPEWRPLHIHLNAENLPGETVGVQVVNAEGDEVWQGASSINNQGVNVKIPRLTRSGSYLLRLYSPSKDLLREFAFQAK